MVWQKTRINIPEDLGPDERQNLALEIIEFIKTRSQNGVGVRKRGRGFENFSLPAYSKEYAERKGQTNVDLTLSTEMLESIELLSHSKGSILIGFQNGTDVNAKAEGNQTGSYGRAPNRRKARPFLGITRSDLLDLI